MMELKVAAKETVHLTFGGNNGFPAHAYQLTDEALMMQEALREDHDRTVSKLHQVEFNFKVLQQKVRERNAAIIPVNVTILSPKIDAGELEKLLEDSLKKYVGSRLSPEWQPIETAPKDGTIILLGAHASVREGSGHRIIVAQWDHQDWWFKDTKFSGYTHWMPLPESPR